MGVVWPVVVAAIIAQMMICFFFIFVLLFVSCSVSLHFFFLFFSSLFDASFFAFPNTKKSAARAMPMAKIYIQIKCMCLYRHKHIRSSHHIFEIGVHIWRWNNAGRVQYHYMRLPNEHYEEYCTCRRMPTGCYAVVVVVVFFLLFLLILQIVALN